MADKVGELVGVVPEFHAVGLAKCRGIAGSSRAALFAHGLDQKVRSLVEEIMQTEGAEAGASS